MKVVSNLFSSHGELVSELLSESHDELFFVSPFLAHDLEALFSKNDFSSVNVITLVTTLKKNDQDQITKPESLKSFYQLVNANCHKAKVKVHVDNSLHGKIYIFKKDDNCKAIVSSANLTQSGFYNNHEWGLLIDDQNTIKQLENEVLECIDYPDVTESMVDKLLIYSDQYQRDNPDLVKVTGSPSDILESVYNEGKNHNKTPKYYLKPVGVSEDPIWKEDKEDFSDLHQNLDFSKKGTGSIKGGDFVITTAIGCGCLLSYFQITGWSQKATDEEILVDPWKKRWPWHIEARNLSVNYGGSWWNYDLNRKVLLDEFLKLYPNVPVTKAGGYSLGAINRGSDKLEITQQFAEFLISKITATNEQGSK